MKHFKTARWLWLAFTLGVSSAGCFVSETPDPAHAVPPSDAGDAE